MQLESVSEYLSRGGRVTRCRPGEFGHPTDGMDESRSRGGQSTATQRTKYLPGPGPELGKRVRAVRLQKGYGLDQVGLALGKSGQWVSLLEHGQVSLTRSRERCRKTADQIVEWLKVNGG